MIAKAPTTVTGAPVSNDQAPGRRSLQEVKERLRETVPEIVASRGEVVPPRPAVSELREATWAILDKAVEHRGQSNLSGETGDYDFSGLTDQELAQEMLAEFPGLLAEARRMSELSPKDDADLS